MKCINKYFNKICVTAKNLCENRRLQMLFVVKDVFLTIRKTSAMILELVRYCLSRTHEFT
jgi:hypothetical protein